MYRISSKCLPYAKNAGIKNTIPAKIMVDILKLILEKLFSFRHKIIEGITKKPKIGISEKPKNLIIPLMPL